MANEGLIAVKTADDGLLVAAGDRGAVTALIEDGVAIATGGLGPVVEDGTEDFPAAGEVDRASTEVEESVESVSGTSARTGNTEAAGETNTENENRESTCRTAETEIGVEGPSGDRGLYEPDSAVIGQFHSYSCLAASCSMVAGGPVAYWRAAAGVTENGGTLSKAAEALSEHGLPPPTGRGCHLIT